VLVDAVASAVAQKPAPLEVVLVIDHNDDLLAKARAQFLYDERVVVVANAQQQGLSGARNTGVAKARGDVVAFLDDDAVARWGWLAWLTEASAAAGGVFGTGGVALPRWETGKPDWFPEDFLWVVGCSYVGLPTEPAPIRNPIGANMAFRRMACAEAG